HPALARGKQIVREYRQEPGLFSVSRFDPKSGAEYLLAYNTSGASISVNSTLGYRARRLESLAGTCPTTPTAPGSVALTLPPFGYAICRVSETVK
ncbi:MAG: alpha-amylase, partial [Pontixanthobacter sp.]